VCRGVRGRQGVHGVRCGQLGHRAAAPLGLLRGSVGAYVASRTLAGNRKTMQCLSVHVSGIVSVMVWQVGFHRQSAVWLARPAEEQADDF